MSISASHIPALAHLALQDTSFSRHECMLKVWDMHNSVAQPIHIKLQTVLCVLLLTQPVQKTFNSKVLCI